MLNKEAFINGYKHPIGVGCDPEFFLVDTTRGSYVSAHDLVPGTKDKPFALEKGAVQADGVAVEFNIDPAYTALEFVENNNKVLEQIRKMIPKKYTFAFKPSIIFDEEYFKKLPADPKKLGCDPDYSSVYGNMRMPPVPSTTMPSMRTGAGHLHISWTKGQSPFDVDHRWDCNTVAKSMYSIFQGLIPYWDKDVRRISLYGSLDAIRYKSYGVEFRGFSNAWLNHPQLWPWLFNATTAVVSSVRDGSIPKELAMYSQWSQRLPTMYNNMYRYEKKADSYKDVIKEVQGVIKDFPDLPEINEDG